MAYLTLVERKLLAIIQKRRGPNVVGFFGLIQPLVDGIKLLIKELTPPLATNKILFLLCPIVGFFLSLMCWALLPFNGKYFLYNFNYSIFLMFALMSLNVYSLILGGWSSNSKYAFLGAIRAVGQMLSYEIILFFSIFPNILLSETLNLIEMVFIQEHCWFIFILPVGGIIFFIVILAETNRTPFDLPEAEGELVSGYNIEYSSMVFALFFLSEYANILLVSGLFSLFFLGGWNIFNLSSSIIFSIKITFIATFFIIFRAILPRYRYDQLIEIGWQILLPITFGYFICVLATKYLYMLIS